MPSKAGVCLLLHSGSNYVGGVARILITLANSFSESGWPVQLVTTNAGGARPTELAPSVMHHDLGARGLRDAFWPLVHYLRDRQPRVMLSAMEHPNLLAIAARRLASPETRLVISSHGSLQARLKEMWGLKDRCVIRTLVPPLYSQADAIVAVSEGVARELRQLVPRANNRIYEIFNPITLPGHGDGEISVPGEGPLVISAGRFTPLKDFQLLLQAVALTHRRRPIRLALIGDGEQRGELESRALALGISDITFFPGWTRDLTSWMRAADLFVLSSRWEGFGNVLVEAMACGCPVVSTDCPHGPREILDGGRYGHLVPVGDFEALAYAIESALSARRDPDVLRQRAEMFSVERSVAAYREVLGLSPIPKLETRIAKH